jgi:hypothetical protein
MSISKRTEFNQKIEDELAPLIGKDPGSGDEKSLRALFISAQQAIAQGLDPANLRKIDRVLRRIAGGESEGNGSFLEGITQIFQRGVEEKPLKLTSESYQFYIKLCDHCHFAVKQLEAKKKEVGDLLGIVSPDSFLDSEESDALIARIPKRLNLGEFKREIGGCFYPWMSSVDKVKLLTVLSSLDLKDSCKVSHLLGFIFSLGRCDFSDIEKYIPLILKLPSLESLKELIPAIFLRERILADPSFIERGLTILSDSAEYIGYVSVRDFLPGFLEQVPDITSVNIEKVASKLVLMDPNVDHEQLVAAIRKRIPLFQKNPEAAAHILKALSTVPSENWDSMLYLLVYSVPLTDGRDDSEGCEKFIEILSKIQLGSIFKFFPNFKAEYQKNIPSQERLTLSQIADMICGFSRSQFASGHIQAIALLSGYGYLSSDVIQKLNKVGDNFFNVLQPCSNLLERVEDKKKLIEECVLLSKKMQIDMASFFIRICRSSMRLENGSLIIEKLSKIIQIQDHIWRNRVINTFADVQTISLDDRISLIEYFTKELGFHENREVLLSLAYKLCAEHGVVDIFSMKKVSAMTIRGIIFFQKKALELLSCYLRVDGFQDERNFIVERLASRSSVRQDLFFRLFFVLAIPKTLPTCSILKEVAAFSSSLPEDCYVDIAPYLEQFSDKGRLIEFLKGCITKEKELVWYYIGQIIRQLEHPSTLQNPKEMIEKVISLAKEVNLSEINDLVRQWNDKTPKYLSAIDKLRVCKMVYHGVSKQYRGHALLTIKNAFLEIQLGEEEEFLSTLEWMFTKMGYNLWENEFYMLKRDFSGQIAMNNLRILRAAVEEAPIGVSEGSKNSVKIILSVMMGLRQERSIPLNQLAKWLYKPFNESSLEGIAQKLHMLFYTDPKAYPIKVRRFFIMIQVFLESALDDIQGAVDLNKIEAIVQPLTISAECHLQRMSLRALARVVLRGSQMLGSQFFDPSQVIVPAILAEIEILLYRAAKEDRTNNIEMIKVLKSFFIRLTPLFKQGYEQHILSIQSIVDNIENIYAFHDGLCLKADKPVSDQALSFRVSDQMVVSFGLHSFSTILGEKITTYEQLPLIDPDTLKNVFQRMCARLLESGVVGIQQYLRDRGVIGREMTMWEIQDNIVSPQKQINIAAHTAIPVDGEARQKPAPAHVVKAFKIIKEVMELSDEIPPGEVVSPKEYRVLLIGCFLCHCASGQTEGLFQLDLFLRSYRGEQIEEGGVVEDFSSEAEEGLVQRKKFIETYLSSVFSMQEVKINELMTSINPMIQDLGVHGVYLGQMVHQSLYLKNLLGKSLALNHSISFDPYMEWIAPNLVAKTKEEVMAIFCRHYGPSFFADVKDALSRALEQDMIKTSSAINNCIPQVEEDMWTEDYSQLTDKGVAALLVGLHILSSLSV